MSIILFLYLTVIPCTDTFYAVTVDRYGNVTPRCDNASSIDPWITWFDDEIDTPIPAPTVPPEKQKLIERVVKTKDGAVSFYGIAHQENQK